MDSYVSGAGAAAWISGGLLLLIFLLLIWRQGWELTGSHVGGATVCAKIDWHLPHVH